LYYWRLGCMNTGYTWSENHEEISCGYSSGFFLKAENYGEKKIETHCSLIKWATKDTMRGAPKT